MQLIDFSGCRINKAATYGGSDRKFGIFYDGEPYMLKFSEKISKNNELAVHGINNCISEFLGSHIASCIGLPTHETLLGYYDGELVVACKDFCSPNQVAQEFSVYMRMRFYSCEVGKLPKLEQIYDVVSNVGILEPIKDIAIKRYWDTFVIDALLANFDRHKGNWGYLVDKVEDTVSLAPTYDYGSTLYPTISDEALGEIVGSAMSICERVFVFPTAALLINNCKVHYLDVMTSGYCKDCSDAILRIVPKINLEAICGIIQDTPVITQERKDFYKLMVRVRKKFILDEAFKCVNTGKYDMIARQRLESGQVYDKAAFLNDWERGLYSEQERFVESELNKMNSF